MVRVEARAQQQENGSDIWLMVSFSGPFKVSVDRTWVPRDKRKFLKNIWSIHSLQSPECAHRLSCKQICYHSLSLILNSANMRP